MDLGQVGGQVAPLAKAADISVSTGTVPDLTSEDRSVRRLQSIVNQVRSLQSGVIGVRCMSAYRNLHSYASRRTSHCCFRGWGSRTTRGGGSRTARLKRRVRTGPRTPLGAN
eukprot:4473310-Pyramimonas_sp.AAC.1